MRIAVRQISSFLSSIVGKSFDPFRILAHSLFHSLNPQRIFSRRQNLDINDETQHIFRTEEEEEEGSCGRETSCDDAERSPANRSRNKNSIASSGEISDSLRRISGSIRITEMLTLKLSISINVSTPPFHNDSR